jgi:hypothetical protein
VRDFQASRERINNQVNLGPREKGYQLTLCQFPRHYGGAEQGRRSAEIGGSGRERWDERASERERERREGEEEVGRISCTAREEVARGCCPSKRPSSQVLRLARENQGRRGTRTRWVLEGTQGWWPRKTVAIPGVPGSRSDSFGSRKGLRRRPKDGESALLEVGDFGPGVAERVIT